MITIEQLQTLKEKVEKGKSKVAELKGERKSLMATLKKEFECDTIEEAEKLLEKTKKEIVAKKEEIQEKEIALEEEFPQLFD